MRTVADLRACRVPGWWRDTGRNRPCVWPRHWARRRKWSAFSPRRRNGARWSITPSRFCCPRSCRRPCPGWPRRLCKRLATAAWRHFPHSAVLPHRPACPESRFAFAAPCRDEAQIAKLLIEKLAREIDPGFGIEAVALEAAATEPLAPVQRDIGGKTPDYALPLNTLLNRLGARGSGGGCRRKRTFRNMPRGGCQ